MAAVKSTTPKPYSEKAAQIEALASQAADAADALARGDEGVKPATLIRLLDEITKRSSSLAARARADRDKAKGRA